MPGKNHSFQSGIQSTLPISNTHQSNNILSSILKALPGSIYWKDTNGVYLGCNDAMLEMTGMSSIIGKTDFDMPWADSAHVLRENDQRVITLNSPLEIEETVKLASGEELVSLSRKAPLHNEDGQIIGIIGTSLNITQRKEIESRLKQTQEITQSTLENIVANMPGHVYWKNVDGVYLGCNNRQARSLSFNYGSEIIGKTDFDLPWGSGVADIFRKNDLRIMKTGETLIIEEKSQVDGKEAVVLSHKSPMRNKQGDIIGILGISIDISERKKIETELRFAKEQAEAASRAKTEFLENMRHDIRTPLTGIVGFSDIIKSEADNPHIKEYAENLTASSYALLELMDEVLEAIRVSSGEIPQLKKKFVLKDILQHAFDLTKAKAASKRVELSMNIDDSMPMYLLGDSIRIHRIALELLTNALNFTDSGFVKLTVQLASQQNRDIIVKLIVQDTGMGIPKDKQQEIFLHFKRLTPSYKGIYKGAGLGLAVIKQFIDDLDGEIYVDSELQKGTTFTCVIPLKVSLLDDSSGVYDDFEKIKASTLTGAPEQIKPMEQIVSENTKNHDHCVLVVEDNTTAQKVAKALLSQRGCQVDIASAGDEALQLWKANKYDLIFMDIGLPDMDGYQVTRHIRIQEATGNHHVPIIALTAHVGDENKQRCIESGMNAVLTKPLTQKSCKDILASFTPKKQDNQLQQSWASDLPESDEGLFQLSTYPLLDIAEGIKTTGTEEGLCEMLQFFIDTLPDDMQLLKIAHEANDWDKTQQLAHKIKGGVVYVGATRMKMACQYLERYWKVGKRDLLEQLYQQLLQVTDESILAIQEWLTQKKA